MEKAYKYSARTPKGKIVQGIVYSESYPLAFAKLKRASFTPLEVNLDWKNTIESVGQDGFNAGELSRLYQTLGRRMNKGKNMLDGLEGAVEYLRDPRLKQAAMLMRSAITEGQTSSEAMLNSGFPERDAMVIRSTEEAGKTGNTFISLAAEIKRMEGLRKSVKQIVRMPLMIAVLMVIIIYGSLVGIAPQTIKFLSQTGLKIELSAFNQMYFELAKFFGSNMVLASVMYFTIPVGFYMAYRAGWIGKMLDRIKLIRDISMKTDQAALWNSFAIMYDASVPIKEACRMAARAARRDDNKIAFNRVARLVEGGQSLDEAVGKVDFPEYITSQISSAVSSGDIAPAIFEMVGNLEEDLNAGMEVLKENAKMASTLILAVGVLLVFFLSYYPLLSTIMSAT